MRPKQMLLSVLPILPVSLLLFRNVLQFLFQALLPGFVFDAAIERAAGLALAISSIDGGLRFGIAVGGALGISQIAHIACVIID